MQPPCDNYPIDACGPEFVRTQAKSPLIAAAVSGVLLSMTLGSALAAVQVRGQQDNLQILAQDASVRDVLNAIATRFKLTYKLPSNLGTGRNLGGHYSGPLRQILARILDGNDYIVALSNGSVEVVVLGKSADNAEAAAKQELAVSEQTVVQHPTSKSPSPTTAILPSSNPSPPPLSTYVSAR